MQYSVLWTQAFSGLIWWLICRDTAINVIWHYSTETLTWLCLSLCSCKDRPLKIDSSVLGDAVEHALRGRYSGATFCKACTASCMLLGSEVWFEIPFQKIKDICLSELRCLIMSRWTRLEGQPCSEPSGFWFWGTEFENKATKKGAALRTGCPSHAKSEFVRLCPSTELKSCLPCYVYTILV